MAVERFFTTTTSDDGRAVSAIGHVAVPVETNPQGYSIRQAIVDDVAAGTYPHPTTSAIPGGSIYDPDLQTGALVEVEFATQVSPGDTPENQINAVREVFNNNVKPTTLSDIRSRYRLWKQDVTDLTPRAIRIK